MTHTVFIDLDSHVATASATGTAAPDVPLKHLTKQTLAFAFHSGGTVSAVTGWSAGRVVIKATPTSDVLLLDTTLAATGSTTSTRYSAEWAAVDCDSAALRTLIGASVEPLEVFAEIQWTADSGTHAVAFPIQIVPTFNLPEDDPPDPTSAAGWEWIKARLAAGSNITFTDNDTTQVRTIASSGGGGGGGGGGSTDWGDIGGTLSDQTDLQTALNNKQPLASALTTLSSATAAGLALMDDADAAAQRTTLGLGNVNNTSDANKPISTATQTALDAKVTGPASATDNAIARFDGTTGKVAQNSGITIADGTSGTLSGTNSGDVTLAGTPDYLTISGQQITLAQIDLTADVTGVLPIANIATGTPDGTKFVRDDGTLAVPPGGGGSGTVTSVAVSGSDGIEVDSGSPITASGTIALGINASTLSTHLGLGNASTLNVGTTAGTVAAGDDSRFTDARTPTAHAASHVTGGSDAIQSATASQNGLATATQITKLDGIEASADVTDATNVAAAGAVMTGGALGTPSSGTLTNCTGLPSGGLASTSGSGSVALTTSPAFVTPALGAATATSVTSTSGSNQGTLSAFVLSVADATKYTGMSVAGVEFLVSGNIVTIAPPASVSAGSYTLTLPANDGASGQYLKTDGSGVTSWDTAGNALTTNPLSQFAATTSSQLAGVISDETGSGALVFANSPTLVTPALGTPSSGTLTNCTGLPLTSGVTGILPIANIATGTPDGTKFVRDDGTLAVPAGGGGGGGGASNVWIPAAQWIPKTTLGAGVDSVETATHDQNFDQLLFDAGADEFADALVIMPNNWNNGTVTARFYWTASTSSGDVVWGIQARAFANDDALDTAAGTAQTVTDTLTATNDMCATSATSAMTIAGTPAANTPVQFTIYRDANAGGDTLAADARLLGVEILYTLAS